MDIGQPSVDQVIDTYARSKALGKAADDIKRDMEAKIRELGTRGDSRRFERGARLLELTAGAFEDDLAVADLFARQQLARDGGGESGFLQLVLAALHLEGLLFYFGP